MSWASTDLANFMHGITADQQYANVQANHAWLYGYYDSTLAVGAGLNAGVGSTSATDLFKIWLPKNLDNNPINVTVRASMQGSAASYGVITVKETTTGTSASANVLQTTQDDTELANPFTLVSLTPTGGADGREIVIQAKVNNGADTCTVNGIFAEIGGSGSASTKGVKTSGFRTTGSTLVYAANNAIDTEHVEALINGPAQIAKDRPVCILSHLGDVSRTPVYTTTSATYELITTGILRCPDNVAGGRTYKIYANLEGIGGATPSMKLEVAGLDSAPTLSGTGWQSTTFTATPSVSLFRLYLKRTGGSRANLRTIQIFRHQ